MIDLLPFYDDDISVEEAERRVAVAKMVLAEAEADVAVRHTSFRQFWHDLGMSVPELAEALGSPRGTLTKYTHNGPTSRLPPQEVLDAMDALLLERARKVVEARGYALVRKIAA